MQIVERPTNGAGAPHGKILYAASRSLRIVLSLSLAGCLARFPATPATVPKPIFDPTTFFAGRTQGEGTLDLRIGGDRTVRVQSLGATDTNGDFRLDQTITYGNGDVETRVWQLHRLDAQHFTATLSDAKGPVTAESTGSLFHLRYKLRFAVHMEQWLYLQPDGKSVDNRAQITVLGIPWARLAETIVRVPSTP